MPSIENNATLVPSMVVNAPIQKEYLMAKRTLPDSPSAFAEATWNDILPYYEELAARPLTAANAEQWLREWARLEEMVAEASALAYVAYSTDTTSEAKERAQVRFSSEIEPQMHEQHVGLS